jgi:predicted dienelactone hydrolase
MQPRCKGFVIMAITGCRTVHFLARGGVDLHALDLSPAAQDLRDARIKVAVVIDPGIVETLTPNSLSNIDTPMLIVNLGDAGTIPAGVDASVVAKLILKAQYKRLDDATHFSFLAQCKPKGAKILENEGEVDLLCDDAGGRGRGAIHTELKELIVAYLNAHL